MINTLHAGHGLWSSSTDDQPLEGVEGEPVEGAVLDQLLQRQTHPTSTRKQIAMNAYQVYRTCYEAQVVEGITHQQNSETIRADMRRFVTKVRNDARDVTEQVAVVWDGIPSRHIVGESDEIDKDATEAIKKLTAQAAFNEIGMMVNHLGWLQGPQFVVPMVRGKGKRKRLCADVLSPHTYDIVQNEDDLLGPPVAIAWHLHHRKLGPVATETDVFVLDGVSLRRFRVRSGASGVSDRDVSDRDEKTILVHKYGQLPAAGLRFTRPITGDDWYLCDTNSRLVTGTIEVAVKMARMGLVRRAQCHQLLTVVGAIENVAKGQAPGDPEGGIKISTSRPGMVDIGVHDYDTAPDNFIREILFWVQSMIEPLGGHIQVDSGQPDIFGKLEIPHETQVEHRDRQIPAAAAFEADWWAAATAIAKAERLEASMDLPPAEIVHDLFRVDYGALSRALKDPEKANADKDWKLSRGQTSEVKIMQEALGGVSEAEAWAVILNNMENRAKFNDIATKRDLHAGEGGSQTTAEAMGAQGTPQREANREGGEQEEAGGSPPQPAAA